MTTNVTMPQLGESVVEGTVGRWLVKEGQQVEKDQPVVEILTDKADSEIPATTNGVVTKLLVEEGATVSVGDVLLEIDSNAQASGARESGRSRAKTSSPDEGSGRDKGGRDKGGRDKDGRDKDASHSGQVTNSGEASSGEASSERSGTEGPGRSSRTLNSAETPANVAASPALRKMAREQGVDLRSLKANMGRVTATEVQQGASAAGIKDQRQSSSASPAIASAQAGRSSAFRMPPYVERPGDEVVPFSRRRRIIADHMVTSKLTAPHVMTVAECDLHRTSKLRNEFKKALKQEGINLTFLAFVGAAVTKALRKYRELNARVLDDAYVLLKDINLGVAVDTEEGLVVPVIKNADQLTVRGLAHAIDEIAGKAREGRLTPDDLAGKTFTISNPGRKGNLFGAAIISQPNVGILRIGEIQKRVVVVEKDEEDVMAIHPVMYTSLSYDHRIVDGVAANSFLYYIVELLEAGEFEV